MPPLELFSLEEEAAQLPGGLFVCRTVVDKQVVEINSTCRAIAVRVP